MRSACERETCAHNGETPRSDKAGAYVLVGDDEPGIRRVLRLMLESMGYPVLCAADGPEIAQVYASRPDEIGLVLVDMVMPNMGGEQTLRELQRVRSDVKAVLCSGYDYRDVCGRLAAQGWVGFLQKPVEMQPLASLVQTWMPSD